MAAARSGHKSVKHEIIDKANSSMLITVAIAIFVLVFCLFAFRTLVSQSMYQNKVISENRKTLKTLQESKEEAEELQRSYLAFAGESVNVIGGAPTGTGPRDGDNAKLILDALPYELDFPALSASIEKILLDGGYTIQAIGGEDTPASSSDTKKTDKDDEASAQSEVAEIEYPFTINASPEASLSLLQTLERSIRPFKLTSLSIEGSGGSLDIGINMKTFYKPSVGLQVSTKAVK